MAYQGSWLTGGGVPILQWLIFKILSLLVFVFWLPQLYADNHKLENEAESEDEHTRVSLWFGFDLGGMMLESENQPEESSKNGYQFGVKGTLALYSKNVALELGAGWYNNRLFRSEDPDSPTREELEVRTRFGGGVAQARYRFGNHEIGPSTFVSFGTDSTFSPDPDANDKNLNVFFGLQWLYANYGDSGTDHRFGLEMLTDLTIDGRQIYWLNLQYFLGIPLIRPKVIVKEKVTKKLRVVREKEDRFVVDAGFVNFVTNKHDILPHFQRYLEELGQFLAEKDHLWDAILLTSHTDKRGSAELNRKLSLRRAAVIIKVLLAGGLSKDKVRVRSLGPKRPVDQATDDIALARNRRTEITVIGAKKVLRLKDDMARLQQKHRVPVTCEGGICK